MLVFLSTVKDEGCDSVTRCDKYYLVTVNFMLNDQLYEVTRGGKMSVTLGRCV